MHCFLYLTERSALFEAVPSDLDGIVSQLRQTAGVETAIFLYEMEPHTYKVSLRSKESVDVSRIAKYFGGGGHVRAAGVTMKGTVHDVINNISGQIALRLCGRESGETRMLNGILNIYKEKGFTSHDVVAKLRGITKQKKIGHTGTLDPDAEGVLPVCLGRATKVCALLTEKDKIYETGRHAWEDDRYAGYFRYGVKGAGYKSSDGTGSQEMYRQLCRDI